MIENRKKDLKKNVIWNIIGSTFSSFNSLFFLIIVTRINGIDTAGIFSFAFSTACLFYVIGVYSGRTFQVTDNDKKISDADYLNCKIITCIIMIIVSFFFCIIRSYGISKFIIIETLVFFKMLEAFSESNYAVLQKFDKLYLAGKSMFFKAIISLVLFLIVDLLTKNIILSCLIIVITNIVIIIIYDKKHVKNTGFKIGTFNKENVLFLIKKGLFAFGFTFLTQYVINAPKYAIDSLLSDDKQTIYGIISMPATVLVLFGQFIIQPFLVKLKNSLIENKKQFLEIILKMVSIIVLFGIICLVIVYFLGIPVLEMLYSINLYNYKLPLIIIICGSIVYTVTVVLSTALTTMRSTFSQFIIFLIVSIISLFLSHYYVLKMNVMGACLVYAISMLILLLLYIIIFLKKYLEVGDRSEKIKYNYPCV